MLSGEGEWTFENSSSIIALCKWDNIPYINYDIGFLIGSAENM